MEPVKDFLTKGEDGVFRPTRDIVGASENENKEPVVSEEKKEVVNEEENKTEPTVKDVDEQEAVEEKKEEAVKEASPEVLEALKEEGSENNEETDGVEEKNEEIESVKSLSEKDVLSFLSEKLGKDLNSLEDLTAGDKTEEKPVADLDKALQDLKDWSLKSGLPFEDYFKHQKDYDSMSSLKVVEEEMRHKHPDFTEDEIKLEMEQYIPDEETDDERDTALKNLKLKKDSKVARTILNELKSDLNEYTHEASLTEDQKADIELAKNAKQYQEEQKEYKDKYEGRLKEESFKIKKIDLELNDDFTLPYNISDLDRNEIPNLAKNMPHWYNKDGSMKHDAVVKDAAIIQNFKKIVKVIHKQSFDMGIDSLMDKSNNSTLGKTNQKTFESQEVSLKNKPIYSNVSKEMSKYIG